MNAIQQLQQHISTTLPTAHLELDPAERKEGSWWLDITLHGHSVIVEWHPQKGFGITSSTEVGFGEGADEVYTDPVEVEKRVLSLLTERQRTTSSDAVGIRELREKQGLTQVDLANSLSVGQSTISKIERRKDISISALRRTMEALGGELEICVWFDDECVRITQFDDVDEISRLSIKRAKRTV